MVIKRKTKELLVKKLKTCEKKMQELTDSIKSPMCKQRECAIYSTK
jgi:hypothetical protein